FSLNPVNLWAQATGGIDRDVEVDIDEDELAAAVDQATTGLDSKPVEGKVSLDGATVKTRAAAVGLTVEREELADDIAKGWPDQHEFEAPTSKPEPKVLQKEIDAFVKDELKPLI